MKCLIIIAIVIVVLIIIGSMAGGGEQTGGWVSVLEENTDTSFMKTQLEWENGEIFHVTQYMQGDRSKNKVKLERTHYRTEEGVIKVYGELSYFSVPSGTVVMLGRVEENKIILSNKELAHFHDEFFKKSYEESGLAHLFKGTKVREEVVAVINESSRAITSTVGRCSQLAKYQGNSAEAGAAMIGYFFEYGSKSFNCFWNSDDFSDAELRWDVVKRRL